MKYGIYFLLILGLVIGAYCTALQKIESPLKLNNLHLGMDMEELNRSFGSPSAKSRNQITYILDDGSELVITLRDQKVSSATVKFHRLIQIQDPDMRKLSLVQMDTREGEGNRPGWFFAGKPTEGLIYKITTEGVIESITWVPPFSYGNNRPKQLQALLRDFKSQRSL